MAKKIGLMKTSQAVYMTIVRLALNGCINWDKHDELVKEDLIMDYNDLVEEMDKITRGK